MPQNPKVFFPGSLHFITSSVEEGIMFPPNPLVNEIIKKSLAQAQKLHPIDICHLSVQSTHIHLFVRVIDPQYGADFMERFKCESAHALNRLLGRTKRTLWCKGYDSPMLYDVDSVINWVSYLYANPVKDGLIDSVDRYPGVSSWNWFKDILGHRTSIEPQYTIETRYIPRDKFRPLEDKFHSYKDYEKLRRKLIHKKAKNHLVITPNAWFKTLRIDSEERIKEVNQRIIERVRQREKEKQEEFEEDGRSFMDLKTLVLTPIGKDYQPKRIGKRMLVLSVDRKFRRTMISWIKSIIQRGKEVLVRWRLGDFLARYPEGLFPPNGIRLVESIAWNW